MVSKAKKKVIQGGNKGASQNINTAKAIYMKNRTKFDIAVIIVNYHVKKELFLCIQSIINSSPKISYEIIVIDNDEKKTIQKELKRKFPKVIYIPNDNKGFGQGNNVGARVAKGEYLFFLNPDTTVYPNCLDLLTGYLNNNKHVGIVAPLLYDENNNLYPQGANELTPISAIFSFSFIHKLFPNNTFAKKYWMLNEWNKKTSKEVASVPGTAFVIRRKLYEEIHGFDETFFMYFEEHDLCRRVRDLGWKIVMHPPAKVYHALGRSSSQVSNINKVFLKSRFYYFRKHYGIFTALLTEGIMQISKYMVLLYSILFIAACASFYRLDQYMNFIGDQGWYYLSARDMVQQGTIPLVGIPSSHPWLHQGAFWTYILAPVLWLFNFNPLSGAYISILLHLLVIIVLFSLISRMFSQRIGIIATALYSVSPLALAFARTPYHTSPIPLLSVLFFYCVYIWTKGKPLGFVFSVWLLAALYNFQVATFLLTILFILIMSYGFFKKTMWFKTILNKQILGLSVIGFIVLMLPMLIYDIGHGFPQTLKFLAWVGYKILLVFGYPPLSQESTAVSYVSVVTFLAWSYQKLIYPASSLVSFTIALFSFSFLIYTLVQQLKLKILRAEFILLSLLLIIGIIGIIVTKTPSDAYLPTLYPFVILVAAIFFDALIVRRPAAKWVIMIVVILIMYSNIITLIEKNYFMHPSADFKDRMEAAKIIVTEADGRRYNLLGRGEASQFESFTMNYEYLAWWLGNGPSKSQERLQFFIEESPNGIKVTKEIQND